jgi:hypothetical protein
MRAHRRRLSVTDCTEPHTAAPDNGIAGEGQEGTPKEAQS